MNDGVPTPPSNGDGDSNGGTDPEVPVEPINPGNYNLDIDVFLTLSVISSFHGNSGVTPVPPTDHNYNVYTTISCAVRGTISEPGAMVSGGPDGSLPADFNGSIVLDSDKLLVADLFATESETTNASAPDNGAVAPTSGSGGTGGGSGY